MADEELMVCFLCGQTIEGEAWDFPEGLAHPECALSAQTTAAAEDFLAGFCEEE